MQTVTWKPVATSGRKSGSRADGRNLMMPMTPQIPQGTTPLLELFQTLLVPPGIPELVLASTRIHGECFMLEIELGRKSDTGRG